MTRRRSLVLLGVAAALATATAAWAYWSAAGAGSAQAGAATLNAPTGVSASATAGAGTVHLAWTGSTLSTGQPAAGYYAQRVRVADGATAAACGTSPASPTSATACDDRGVPDGTYHYVVTAVFGTWSAASGNSDDVTVVGDVTAPAVTLTFPQDGTAQSAAGWSGGCATAGICGTASDASGVASVALSVRQGASGLYWGGSAFNQSAETFLPATGTTSWSLAFARPPDGSYTVHVRATDTTGNTTPAGSYITSAFTVDTAAPTGSITAPTGTVGGTVIVASDSADGGSGVAAAQFQVASHGGAFSDLGAADTTSPYQATWDTTTVANGQYDLRVVTTDKVGISFTSAVATIAVNNSFQVTVSGSQTAGIAFNATITARANGVTNASYTGSHALSFSGPGTAPDGTHAPVYPSSVTFSGGIGMAAVTLFQAESPTLTATSGNLSGTSAALTVNPAAAASLSPTAASTTPTAGITDNLTIVAKDAYGNTATTYTGSKSVIFGGAGTIGSNHPTVTNSSGSAIDFGSTTAVSFSAGIAAVSGGSNGVMRLYKAEAASITVSDGTLGNASGLGVTVGPASASQFAVSAGATQAAGSAFTVTSLTAQDAYGNTATGYSGSHTITWSGATTSPGGTAPSYPTQSVSFTNGVSTTPLTATLFAAGSNSLTASASSPAVTGTTTITVKAGTSKGLNYTAQSLTGGGSVNETCNTPSTSCTITNLKKNGGGSWIAKVGVIDTWGNPTTASSAVTVTLTASLGKGIISPSSVVTIPVGASVSTSSFTYSTGNGGSYNENVTASGSGGGVTNTGVASVTTT